MESDATLVRHLLISSRGQPTSEELARGLRELSPLCRGKLVVSTGVLRTDIMAEDLTDGDGCRRLVITDLGPIRTVPLPRLSSGEVFHSLISLSSLVRTALSAWADGLLLSLCEPPLAFLKRTERGMETLRRLGPSLVICHQETVMAARVITGEMPTLAKAVKKEVPHLSVYVFKL